MTNAADRRAELPGDLDDDAVVALTNWVRGQGLGSTVADVEPLALGVVVGVAPLGAAEAVTL